MKLNWGYSIAIFYAVFMVIMITMVVKASKQGVDLVQENYYEKDLNYEQFRESRALGAALKDQIQITMDSHSKSLEISFPKDHEVQSGTVTFYRPSSTGLDRNFPLELDKDYNQVIPTTDLLSGLWRLQLNWNSNNKAHHLEKIITI